MSNHPRSPSVDIPTFERWVFEVFIPDAIDRGTLTEESALSDFLKNEGSMPEFRFDG